MKKLTWWQIIPLVGYLLLKGRCFYCNKPISWCYPIVELLTAISWVILFIQIPYLDAFLYYLLFFSGMIVIAGIDISFRIILNRIILWLLFSGIILNYLFQINNWIQSLLGLLLATLSTLLLRWYTTIIYKKESLGFGDIKLSAIMGYYLGFELFLVSLFIGSIIGVIYQEILGPRSIGVKDRYLPLAPFLGIGALFGIVIFINP